MRTHTVKLKKATWRLHRRTGWLIAEKLNRLSGLFRHTDICGVDFYSGTPTGVARLAELIWQLIASEQEFTSVRIRPKAPVSYNIGRPELTLWFANARDLARAVRRFNWLQIQSRRNIGYWAYELEQMSSAEAANAHYLSEVWAISEFVAATVRRSCPLPCYVVPPPILLDTNLQPGRRDYARLNEFLVVFDAYSSAERKNPWTTIAAFNKAFAGDKSRRLTIRVVRPHGLLPSLRERLLSYESEQIRIVFETFSSVQAAHDFMRQYDVYLSLHRTEGLGFNIIEAILMGLPVIATRYGGNVDFCDAGGVDLINYDLVPGHDPQGLYQGDFVWAEPKLEDAAEALERLITRSPTEIASRVEVARGRVLSHFDSQRIAALIVSRLHLNT